MYSTICTTTIMVISGVIGAAPSFHADAIALKVFRDCCSIAVICLRMRSTVEARATGRFMQTHPQKTANERSRDLLHHAGVLTTWKKGILLRGGPRTRRFALYKAGIEAGLFLYMAPFILTVCYWFLTTPGVNIWLRLVKCVMELPSVIFQFTWAAACVKYWHMLDEDGVLMSSCLRARKHRLNNIVCTTYCLIKSWLAVCTNCQQ